MRKDLSNLGGTKLWRSLDELAGTPQFKEMLHREFPTAASEWDDGPSRRSFLKLMAASLALAGVGIGAGCTRKPQEQIVPYVMQPEQLVPGRPLFFATAHTLGGYARGILVEQHEGRPTKIEGNPDHPASLGATDVFAQASVLNLYDPDRAQTVTKFGEIQTWSLFVESAQAIAAAMKGSNGAGFRILTGIV